MYRGFKTFLSLFAFTMLSSHSAVAYEILPHDALEAIKNNPIHEAMTVSSFLCSNDQTKDETNSILSCDEKYRDLKKIWEEYKSGKALDNENSKIANTLIQGTRWPDDPLRNLSKLKSTPKWGQVFASCKKLIFPYAGSCSNRLCQSHFGNLQTWHAMKPSRPWCDGQSDFGCNKKTDDVSVLGEIVEWADFLSGVVTADIPLDKPLNDYGGEWFDSKCDKVYPISMQVRDLFRTDCSSKSNAVQITFCNVLEINDEDIRSLALGALLHLVQDSYSRSHVYRDGVDSTCPTAMVSCGKPVSFYDYAHQNSAAHKKSDQWPDWSKNCASEKESVDPISAGATIIYLANKGDRVGITNFLKSNTFLSELVTEDPENELQCYKS